MIDMIKNNKLNDLYEAFQLTTQGVEELSMILLDDTGKILTWNKGAQKLKGYSAEEIIGQNVGIFYLPGDRQAGLPEKILDEARKKGHATFIGRRIRRNGTIFWGKIEITAIKDKDGKVIGFTKLARELKEETILGDFWFDADGILYVKASPIPVSPEKLQELRKKISSAIGDKLVCAIVDMREAVLKDIENMFPGSEIRKRYKAIAFISNAHIDPNTRALLKIIPPEVPQKVFQTQQDAKEWISQYI
jgi:PAS domain S-box-containing protein